MCEKECGLFELGEQVMCEKRLKLSCVSELGEQVMCGKECGVFELGEQVMCEKGCGERCPGVERDVGERCLGVVVIDQRKERNVRNRRR